MQANLKKWSLSLFSRHVQSLDHALFVTWFFCIRDKNDLPACLQVVIYNNSSFNESKIHLCNRKFCDYRIRRSVLILLQNKWYFGYFCFTVYNRVDVFCFFGDTGLFVNNREIRHDESELFRSFSNLDTLGILLMFFDGIENSASKSFDGYGFAVFINEIKRRWLIKKILFWYNYTIKVFVRSVELLALEIAKHPWEGIDLV